MNPFGEQSSSHSTWPVTLCIYNLSPWLCMKRKFVMMPVLIQGPRQPGNGIDVYLRPLVEELLLLWNRLGVHVWDEQKQGACTAGLKNTVSADCCERKILFWQDVNSDFVRWLASR